MWTEFSWKDHLLGEPPISSRHVPSGTFTEISGNGCGLEKGGAILCWGNEAGFHNGPFTQMTAADNFACGLRPGGAVTCWGFPWPKGTFSEFSAGHGCACGVRPDGGVECWGQNVKYPAGTPLGVDAFAQ